MLHTVLVDKQHPAREMADALEKHGTALSLGAPTPELLTTMEAAIEFCKTKGSDEVYHYVIDLNLGSSPEDGVKLVEELSRYYDEFERPVLIGAKSSESDQQSAAIKAGAKYFIPKSSVDKNALEVIHEAAMFDTQTPDALLRRVELELAKCAVVEACERLESESRGMAPQDGARDEIRGILEFRTLDIRTAQILTMLDQQLTETKPRELSKDLCKFLSRGLRVAIDGKEHEKLTWLDGAYARNVQGIIPWLDNGDEDEGQDEENDDNHSSEERPM